MREAFDHHFSKDGFRLRGTAMSRVDGFSDVVFGFALTLLVVSLEVPKTYAELHELMQGFFAFAISFTFLIMLWFAHFRLFRRLGLHDHATILVNAVLLFVVLFFVYPLKFLFTMLLTEDKTKIFTSYSQVTELMVVYGLGFAVVYLLIATLYWIGWLHRDELELNSLERVLLRGWIEDTAGVGLVGVLSAVCAGVVPAGYGALSGFVFWLIVPFKVIHGRFSRRRAARARERLHHLRALERGTLAA